MVKNSRIVILVSENQKDRLKEKAFEEGYSTLTDYIKDKLKLNLYDNYLKF